jgi:mono/diheme cytochrome c family protein
MSATSHFQRLSFLLFILPSCITPVDAGSDPGSPSETGSPGQSTGGISGSNASGGSFGPTSLAGQSGQGGQAGSPIGAGGQIGSTAGGGATGSPSGGSGGAIGAPTSDAGGPVNAGCAGGTMPTNVQQILQGHCLICHGSPPLAGVPASLATYDGLSHPAKSDPGQTVAQVSLNRVSLPGGSMRMPPVGDPLTASEIQIYRSWIETGMPLVGCAAGTVGAGGQDGGATDSRGGGTGADVGAVVDAGPDPFGASAKCSSGKMWTGGTKGSQLMQPGEACITCHSKNDGPKLAFGGTVYPTGHEPSLCNGADGSKTALGAQVVVTDGAGKSFTAAVNAAGNFLLKGAATPPLKAKVVFMGKERLMIGAVPSGDCNSCHTQSGSTSVAGGLKAPGRIVLP